jgi:hypothetical protein
MLRWAGPSAPRFQAIRMFRGPVASGARLAATSDGLSLDQYTTTFWAVRGEPRSVQINYVGSTGETGGAFLQFENVDPAYVPGRGPLVPGDSVQITITIDSSNIGLGFEPQGLLFQQPAPLRISYGGADGDLNGDGAVDEADAQIEQQLLGLWYRQGTESDWSPIPAVQSLSGKSFTSALEHFSQYAISW